MQKVFVFCAAITVFFVSIIQAEQLPCLPCGGLSVADPSSVTALFENVPSLDNDALMFVRFRLAVDGSADLGDLSSLSESGATPWVSLIFKTPAPITSHLEDINQEFEAAALLAAQMPAGAYFQIVWSPPISSPTLAPGDYAFILKRAAVAIAGANPGAQISTGAMAHDQTALRTLFDEEIAAYIDVISLEPADTDTLRSTVNLLIDLDPGRPIAIDAEPMPSLPMRALSVAARNAAEGAAITLFEKDMPSRDDIAAMSLLAREFSGDLSFDPYSTPQAPGDAWAFVRGEDLGLRVIVDMGDDNERGEVVFPDQQLASPTLATINGDTVIGASRTARGLVLTLLEPTPTAIIKLERLSAADLGGFADEFQVTNDWQMPVEEILRRLQVFEDAQQRRIRHYEAQKTMSLRFSAGQGVASIEATFEGNFFYRPTTGFDWTWQKLFINGVKWRGVLPELPLIQPEEAAALPFEILFTKEYNYSLRRTAIAEGRDCWVVDFEPLANAEVDNLFRGTVWIDRELFCRVKTRAIQLGLTGEVLSNEETVFFKPLDSSGQKAAWATTSFFLPIRTVGQETQSVLNAAFNVERETVLADVRINAEGYDERLKLAHQSEDIMIRDTAEGMRYLERNEDGSRTVKTDTNFDSLFLVGGFFYDDSLDYPLPLAGINYFSRNFKGSGKQVNLLFAGIMLNGNIAEPSIFDSKWDAGARVFGFFVPLEETLYRDAVEVEVEAVDHRSSTVELFLGRPLGAFTKLSLAYGLRHDAFNRTDLTADEFVIPQDTFTHSLQTELNYSRAGYRFNIQATQFQRTDWQFWGLPDNSEYDDAQDSYLRWDIALSKSWWIGNFSKFAIELQHLNGNNLDRFSKYDFSTFADASVGGYQGGLVTASEANGVHLSYGFNVANALRFDLGGDAVWATDKTTGLDNELLTGISLSGTTMGPWQTVINFDIGYPIQGPADGFTIRVAFLKLFK